jgi:transcriptional regulator with XRE-family HTH domain
MTDDSKRKRTVQPVGSSSKTPAKNRETATSSVGSDRRRKAATQKTDNAQKTAVQQEPEESLIKRLTSIPGAVADSAFRIVARTTDVPLRVGKALFLRPEQAEMMQEAGRTLKDLREVAGLTRDELSEALDLKDHSLIEAVENGTAILSFELILRLAALLARHDPIPVILKFTRSYNPELWKMLEDWGLGRLSLHFERERQFINIYRRHDAARKLSDEGFVRVLDFTRAAFEMALHFAAEQENVKDKELPEAELEVEEEFNDVRPKPE